jgi:hypothetical protein
MSYMEPSTAKRLPVSDSPHKQATDVDMNERELPHFESLTLPGLFKGPILPEWMRKPFRRKNAPASR